MRHRLKPIAEQTMVITGATSGIGLATARRAAAEGACCVLVARDEQGLQQLVEEIENEGGQAIHVAADVADADALRRVTETVRQRFGGFDTWINNAGVSVFGPMREIDPADHRRVFDTNFWGVVNGSLEAAEHLHERGGDHAGAIVNLGSLVSERAVPVQGMYSASKHAVKGFTDAFRVELNAARSPISVSLIKPASIATPFPDRAGNRLDKRATLPPPLYDPDVVARAILHCAAHPTRDLAVGGATPLVTLLARLAPRLTDRFLAATGERAQTTDAPEHRHHFALHRPGEGLRQRGRYRRPVARSSLYTRAAMHPVAAGLLALGALAALGGLARYGRRPRPTTTTARLKRAARRLR